MGVKGRIHSVETFGTLDGPGIRYVLFLQGCPLQCLYCHNPDTWDAESGELRDSEELVQQIRSYTNFIKRGGVTLSGGEPLLQPEFALDLLSRCRREGFHTAIDTSGSVPLKVAMPVVDAADLLLLDIKSYDEELCLRLTGKSGKQALALLAYCESILKPVWIRHVLVPGYTLDKEKLEDLADFLKPFQCVEKVELLPFHKMGEYKWESMRMPYALGATPVPTKAELAEARAIFENRGLAVLMKG